MPVDYSKFDKIVDSDGEGEEDYDAYLRSRYGVTTGWQPGCGMQPPMLGGRTPGKLVEECEIAEPMELQFEGAAEPDLADGTHEVSNGHPSASAGRGGGRWFRWLLVPLRLIQVIAWLGPILFALYIAVSSSQPVWGQQGDIEAIVYPIVIMLATGPGLLDCLLVLMGAAHGEGPPAVAFMCWMKHLFLAMSFFAYEAQYTSAAVTFAGVPLRSASGLILSGAWAVRKTCCYRADIVAAFREPAPAPGAVPSLLAAAVAEAIFFVVHAANLPGGVTLFGVAGPWVIRCATALLLCGCNAVIAQRLVPWPQPAGAAECQGQPQEQRQKAD